ncbi:MAG: serine protease [Dysgonamonadaceae bacterium]|jgi:hypothetical protein|nr:serine protease [Dysgonamonadaceae bacterium]
MTEFKSQFIDTFYESCFAPIIKNAKIVHEEHKTTNTMQKSIFSILYRDDDKVIHTGTGFLIAQNGLFITAGHVFRQRINPDGTLDPNRFLAYFADTNTLIKINLIWFKSLVPCQQKNPEYIDIAVGILETDNTSYLILDRRRPGIGQNLKLCGYISKKKINNYGTDFEHLIDLEKITFSLIDMGIKYQDALISDADRDYRLGREKADKNRLFNNCITLSGKFRIGTSGCPAVDNNGMVKGILIGSPKITDETHILLSKWCSKQVQFHPYVKYNPYEYLNNL